MRIALPADSSVRRKVLIGLGVIGLLAVSGSLLAISRDKAEPAVKTTVYELAKSDVVSVEPQTLQRSLRVSGSLTPIRHATVKSHSVGTLLELHVQEGDRVRAGALLARIDPRNLQAELDARTAALHKAQADLILATKNRDNSVALLKQKLISQNAFDQTVANYDASVANEQAAQAQVRLAQNALADTEIRADFNGVVATRHVQAGERVLPDSPLVTLVDLTHMQLEAMVPMADVPSISIGQVAHFHVDGFESREFVGAVERINPQAVQGSRSLTVYLSVNNFDGALKGGMFAEGDLVLQRSAPVIALPQAAVHIEGDAHYVLALHNGTIAKQAVHIGETYANTGLVEVRDGLAKSQLVIVSPLSALKPGMQAIIAAEPGVATKATS